MDPEQLKKAIESQHGAHAEFSHSARVHESFQGQTVWDGEVLVFDLRSHPDADRAYAWSSPIEGSDKRRVFAVLQIPPISSARDAVKAAIVAEHRAK